MRQRLIGVSICIAAIAGGAAVASADNVVGNTNQNNSGANTGSQMGIQSQGGGIVVGDQTQLARNTVANTNPSTQTVGAGAGSNMVGNATQANTQGNVEAQAVTQNSNGGTNSGTTFQGAVNAGSYTGTNNQAVSFGGAIVGNPLQTNLQYDGASQGVIQDPTIVDADLIACLGSGNVCQSAENDYTGPLVNFQTTGAASTVLVGNPGQANSQNTVVPQYIGQSFLASPDTSTIVQDQAQNNGTTEFSQMLIF
jgi:hypothetical protein